MDESSERGFIDLSHVDFLLAMRFASVQEKKRIASPSAFRNEADQAAIGPLSQLT